MKIVVVGIDTEVGKTVVATLIAMALDGSYWKPVQCGTPSDLAWVEGYLTQKCYPSAYFFKTPCSPHLAARIEGITPDPGKITPPEHNGVLIIEGTGGVLAPLNESETWADVAVHWDAYWVLVHRHYLGSLNHFLLTVESLKQRKVPLAGVIFNGVGDLATEEMLLNKARCPCLARLNWETKLTPRRMREIAHTWKPHLQEILGL